MFKNNVVDAPDCNHDDSNNKTVLTQQIRAKGFLNSGLYVVQVEGDSKVSEILKMIKK